MDDIATLEELRDGLRDRARTAEQLARGTMPELNRECAIRYNKQADALDRLLTERAKMMAIPEGWKLVPIEPTDRMIVKGVAPHRELNLPSARCRKIYAAMIEAAPQPPKATADE